MSRWSTFWVKWHADRPDADWQVLYNAACYFALIDKADDAFPFLIRALNEGGAAQLNGLVERDGHGKRESWIDRDPDLEKLRSDPRWKMLRDGTGHRYPYSSAARRNAIVQGLLSALGAVALVAIVLLVPWLWLGIVAVMLAVGWFAIVIVQYHRSETKFDRRASASSGDGRIRDAPRADRSPHQNA